MKTIALFLLSVAVAFLPASAQARGEVLHVTSVRQWQPTDPAPISRVGSVYVVTGTVDGKTYQLQQLKSFGVHLVQVGQDYPVVRQTARVLTVQTVDPKGRADTERLDVTGVTEAAPTP